MCFHQLLHSQFLFSLADEDDDLNSATVGLKQHAVGCCSVVVAADVAELSSTIYKQETITYMAPK